MIITVDNIFFQVSLNISTHFEVLQQNLRNLSYENPMENLQQLKNLIPYHVKLLDLTYSLNQNFTVIIYWQLVFTAIQMCLAIFQILEHSSVENLFHVIPNYCFFSAAIGQTFLYCYGGDAITNASFNVNFAIQESGWYNLPPSDRIHILIIMTRVQKPLVITSAGFIVSFKTFYEVTRFTIKC